MNGFNAKPRLFIFAKAPRLGRVKTRLAADIGHVHARRIYRAMSAKILREMQSPLWETVLYITPDTYQDAEFGGLWPEKVSRFAQNGGDLSDRCARIFTGKGPVITIGTDIPAMRRSDVVRGFQCLRRNDAVIGPAKDGGFYLLGLNGPARTGLFEDIRWSHPQTCGDMFAAVDGDIAVLRTLEDVDDLGSYRRFRKTKHC